MPIQSVAFSAGGDGGRRSPEIPPLKPALFLIENDDDRDERDHDYEHEQTKWPRRHRPSKRKAWCQASKHPCQMIADATAALMAVECRKRRGCRCSGWNGPNSQLCGSRRARMVRLRRVLALLRLVKSFAVDRTKANVNPPAPVPQITGADT